MGAIRGCARILMGAVAVLVAAGGCAPVAAASGGGSTRATATLGPLLAGTTSYVGGTLVYTGYPYKDTGASTDGTSYGAATYPSSVPRGNGANLIQLQLSATPGGDLRVTAVLESLVSPDIPLLGVGFDADGNRSTGAAAVPGGAWPASVPLGLDVFVTVSSAGATVMSWSGGHWTTVARVPASVSTAAHTMTATLPHAALPPLRGRWNAVGVLGLAVPGSTWLDGSGPIYDLAFTRGDEPYNDGGVTASAQEVAVIGRGHTSGANWQDRPQAAILHGTGDATGAIGTLDFASMRAGLTTVPDTLSAGYHTWAYHSNALLGDGIVDGTAAGGLWAGSYQPYLVQVPAHLTAPAPLVLYLHGGGGNHLDNGVFAPQGALDQGGAMVVYPFAREFTTGTDHGYKGASEQDVVDVLRDVEKHYPVDTRRVVSVGTSTGGAAAFRFAQLYPDLFSGALILSGYDDTHVEENLTNLSLRMVNGIADPLANQGTLALTQREFDSLGDVDYRSYSALAHTHADPQAAVSQCVLDGMLTQPAVTDPARVVYGIDPANEIVDSQRNFDQRHTGAYWVSGLVTRPGIQPNSPLTNGSDTPGYGNAVVAQVAATTLARADRARVGTAVEGAGQNLTAGADFCGPGAAMSNDIWRVHGLALSPAPAQTTSNGFTATLTQLSAAAFDLRRMGVDTTGTVTATISGDGPTTLTLRGGWVRGDEVSVTRDGRALMTVTADAGSLVLSADLTGSHTYAIRTSARGEDGAGASALEAQAAAPALPLTTSAAGGGPAVATAIAGLALGARVARRLRAGRHG